MCALRCLQGAPISNTPRVGISVRPPIGPSAQGLEQAQPVLLEPYYSFQVEVESDQLGRVLSDVERMHCQFDAPELTEHGAILLGRGPVSTLMGYSRELAAFTKGHGQISLTFDGYEPCHNTQEVVERIGYDKDRDIQNTSDSVFCSHGPDSPIDIRIGKAHPHQMIS